MSIASLVVVLGLVLLVMAIVTVYRRFRKTPRPPDDESTMGMDFGIGALWTRLTGRGFDERHRV